jgi:anti-sigma regulatory factor (Ser/Thr protein kinase)
MYAAGEAFDNAIEHGRDEFFVVEARCDGSTLTLRIHDQGSGFTVGDPVPLMPDELRERGLGVFMMRKLMDEARFEVRADGGTTVTLVKNKQAYGISNSVPRN